MRTKDNKRLRDIILRMTSDAQDLGMNRAYIQIADGFDPQINEVNTTRRRLMAEELNKQIDADIAEAVEILNGVIS